MSKRVIKAGATDQTIDIFVPDSSSTVGAGLTGLVYNTSGLTCYYRKGATGTPTALALATQTVGGAHSDGGFVAVDGTNCPGQYRLDLSDTIVATAGAVTLYLRGATNMAPVLVELAVGGNPADVTDFGGTAGTFSGGRPEVNVSHAAGTAWNSGAITANTLASDAITAAKIASDVTTEVQSGLATAADLATAAGYIDTEVAAIKAKTDQLTFTVANKVDANILNVAGQTASATGAVDFDDLGSGGGDATAANQAEIKRMIASLQR